MDSWGGQGAAWQGRGRNREMKRGSSCRAAVRQLRPQGYGHHSGQTQDQKPTQQNQLLSFREC